MPRRATDPFASFNFLVEIDGIVKAGFSEVTGLNSETNVIDYREGNDSLSVRKLPGTLKFGNVTLKRGVTDDKDLFNWRDTVASGDIKRVPTMSVILRNEKGDEAVRWNLFEVWVSKYTAPDLKASGNEIAIESVELVHERMEIG
jgi:phage tail-like protein